MQDSCRTKTAISSSVIREVLNYPKESSSKNKSRLRPSGDQNVFLFECLCDVPQKHLRKAGRFRKAHPFSMNDMIFAGKLIQEGYAIAYVAEARVVHSHNYTNRQQLHRNFDLAVSQADHPGDFCHGKIRK